MRLHRFYIEQPLGEELVIVGKELVHQWISVFRYESGDEVILFSSSNLGVDYIYRIQSADKNKVVLSPVAQQDNILPNRKVVLYMAVVKKDTFENVVRYATELGVSSIVPIIATRSEKKNLNMERLSIIAKEATEQSGRGSLVSISEIVSFKEACDSSTGVNIFGSLYGETFADLKKGNDTAEYALWIGPEGGWTEDEERIAKEKGFRLLKLTDTTLRADTAAIAGLSTLFLA